MFFNGGYLPLSSDFLHHVVGEAEAHCAMMYHFVAGINPALDRTHVQRVLDVGCGQGGGLRYLATLFPLAQVTGTDRSRAAVLRARRNLSTLDRVDLIRTGSGASGFVEGPFDLVIGVGTPTYIGLRSFVLESARVLKEGGKVSISGGYRQGDHCAVRAELEAAGTETGCDLITYQDITPNTFAALEADIPRREAALARVPWPFDRYGRRWADLPGSEEYEEYRTGRRVDFAAVLQRT
jgi:SAM-dependent methyltransferase